MSIITYFLFRPSSDSCEAQDFESFAQNIMKISFSMAIHTKQKIKRGVINLDKMAPRVQKK